MSWTIRYSELFEEWWDGLATGQQEALTARIQLLAEHGPNLGRPTVDSVVGTTRHHHMKELRASKGGALRALFIFDPLRRAVFLVGGDKTGQWTRWYAEMIPVAEDLYDRYLQDEGLI